MSASRGYGIWVDPELGTKERDTVTCAHCNGVFFIEPFQDPATLGGFCKMCTKHTCAKCTGSGKCHPFEKKLEAMERSDRLRRVVDG
jgi:hypothetical protein